MVSVKEENPGWKDGTNWSEIGFLIEWFVMPVPRCTAWEARSTRVHAFGPFAASGTHDNPHATGDIACTMDWSRLCDV